jgi:hypothetical protein
LGRTQCRTQCCPGNRFTHILTSRCVAPLRGFSPTEPTGSGGQHSPQICHIRRDIPPSAAIILNVRLLARPITRRQSPQQAIMERLQPPRSSHISPFDYCTAEHGGPRDGRKRPRRR